VGVAGGTREDAPPASRWNRHNATGQMCCAFRWQELHKCVKIVQHKQAERKQDPGVLEHGASRIRSWWRNLQDECKMQLKNATVLHKSAGKRRKWVHKQAATTRPDPAQQQ